MGKYGDWLVMFVAGSLIVYWLYRLFYRWLHEPPSMNSRVLLSNAEEVREDDENVRFLEQRGYEVTYGKYRLPITIKLDGQTLQSRLFIDLIAEKGGKHYIVKTARDRMPMDWTGSGVRDRLLVYALLMPESEGILFVDGKERTIRTITFRLG
ncbi:hypothetical protein PAECIP111893_03191 [Paenibacillus plantiphilus]|uniref:Uncharacterized protein n=1 Tax=Paenibacillus plantiphilus TaxID=2905650 RepID=A0ABN8GJ24_9BACL|nr:hypothetical protein [Paenibacillus plantiphilus]CAH1210296.1 hypothetical protein PAECIP111893_03191 [Paenibacillus plantiphilus]